MRRAELVVGLILIGVVLGAYWLLVAGRGRTAPVRAPRTPVAVAGSPGSPMPGPASPVAASPMPGAASPVPGTPMAAAGSPMPGGAPLHMREYLAGIVALEKDKSHALTPAQARQVLGTLRRYAELHGAVPEAREQILAALDPQQRAYVEKNVPRRPPSPDPSRSAEQILIDACQAVLSALEKR